MPPWLRGSDAPRLDRVHDEAGLDGLDAFQLCNLVLDETLVVLQPTAHDLEHVVPRTRDQMTFENLVPVKNGRLEHPDFVIVLAAEADGRKGGHGPSLDCRINDRGVPFDGAYLFQASKPPQARRC
ncbi:hypothetical protein AGR9A_Lc40092 [Agrobacterium salinitolerans str. Hayward 0363]|nr:hypothetical protein AGR9A_Lc40092 [Agrobacterium salinitolerans str. Hayward 0363]